MGIILHYPAFAAPAGGIRRKGQCVQYGLDVRRGEVGADADAYAASAKFLPYGGDVGEGPHGRDLGGEIGFKRRHGVVWNFET